MGLPIVRRNIEYSPLSNELHPVLDRIYRGRQIASINELDHRVSGLHHYRELKGIDEAASLLVAAIQTNKRIIIVGDFDADGATSTAVCILSLRQMGHSNIDYLVPNRFDFGYGLSEGIVDVAHSQGAELLLTVDNGIACLAGVSRAKSLGMQVIVTDHHLPGNELPLADAIVNPNQKECTFPSKNLAGVGVAFYLMLACRAQLQEKQWFSSHNLPVPNLATLLDIVAVGTVADVVVLDKNNRVLVHQGLQRIRSGKCRPGIRALVEVARREISHLSAADLGFVVGPRLNAAGRLEDMALGIECLLCEDDTQARHMAAELDGLNQQRRAIEESMKAEAEMVLQSVVLGEATMPSALVVYKEDFHQGVIGIVAGRIKEKYRRPTIAFAHQDEQIIKGSARSVPGLHIRDVLDEVNRLYPGIIIKFGGHAMAAGLSLPAIKLKEFEVAFQTITDRYMAKAGELFTIVSDGELADNELDLSLAKTLRQAGPFGQGFEPPLFDGIFELVSQKLLQEKHLKVVFRLPSGNEVDAIAFNVDNKIWPNIAAKWVQVAYRLDVNVFRGKETVQLMIEELSVYEG
ncbi:single-stranded-DNA-specific exonuclease RecJ [Alteromonas pelagimontana]|uniref:Single-stranded-DNA-specific exonuclease RecJ n=1 Tax=Alteromonas pelagimontana TaxID=1858656 RepID=A0A6M4MC92_9ALTE|nr:single-stranded-DNA-specific exonuclease RecJ [Alteromonas pelagimontana]QJR80270.1 single-stranded-DNA-specific exonuclease RecJ [Alteromonas pelagimontana]